MISAEGLTISMYHVFPLFLPVFAGSSHHRVSRLGYTWKQKQSTIRSGVLINYVFNILMIRVPGVIKGLVQAPLPMLTKTSLCTLMWFTNKCTYLKQNSLAGLHVGALKPVV